MEQKFKGQILTTTKTVNNILKVYNSSNSFSSNDWYIEANLYALSLSNRFNVPLSVSCGVIAALSPLKSWNENKIIAYSFLESGRGKHVNAFVNKAKDIKLSDGSIEAIATILNGNKITRFLMNIVKQEQTTFVTIDRNAVSIALRRTITDNEEQGVT